MRTNRLFALLILLLLGVASATVLAQVPSDSVFQGFVPTSDYILELGGEPLDAAEIYFSERARSWLLMARELPAPLLLNPRARAVQQVDLMKVHKKQDGNVDLLADAVLRQISPFQISGQEVVFEVDGQPAKLKPRPPVLGMHSGAELLEEKVDYARSAAAYAPAGPQIEALESLDRTARVRVYFGSWCPACKRLVPNLLKVEQVLDGSSLAFEYYGLPRPLSDDPETDRAGITGVPTAVVFIGDKEVGRLSGNDFNSPETTLRRLLATP